MSKSGSFEVPVIRLWRHMTRELRHNFRMAAIFVRHLGFLVFSKTITKIRPNCIKGHKKLACQIRFSDNF